MAATPDWRAHLAACADARVLAAGRDGVTGGTLRADIGALTAGSTTPARLRRELDEIAAERMAAGVWEDQGRGRIAPTDMALKRWVVPRGARAWPRVRDVVLVGRALELSEKAALKASSKLLSAHGLRATALAGVYRLDERQIRTPASLRNALAAHVLAKQFGAKFSRRLGAVPTFAGRIGRALASELLESPRAMATDGALIARLAADAHGANGTDLAALRIALIRRMFAQSQPGVGASGAEIVPFKLNAASSISSSAKPTASLTQRRVVNEAAREAMSASAIVRPAMTAPIDPAQRRTERRSPQMSRSRENPAAEPPAAIAEPSLDVFAATVLREAARHAEGWAGNRKAFISRVWHGLVASRRDFGLDEAGFKRLLAGAHREGRLTLANADIRPKDAMDDILASATRYQNTEWHYIRVNE